MLGDEFEIDLDEALMDLRSSDWSYGSGYDYERWLCETELATDSSYASESMLMKIYSS